MGSVPTLEADRGVIAPPSPADANSASQRETIFTETFQDFRQPILALCLHLTGNRADAEDAAQETFLAVFRGLPKFRGEARLSTWIYRIAIRTAFRAKARRPRTEPLEFEPLAPSKGTDERLIERERTSQVAQALRRLPAEQRVVLALFSLEGLSHREIAETLGIPEGTVWSRLHTARKKLVAQMKGSINQTGHAASG